MSDTKVHIHNTSGSCMDLTVSLGLFMDRDYITPDVFSLDQLQRNAEVQKYVNMKFLELLTFDEVAALKKSRGVPTKKVVEIETEFFETMEQPLEIQQAIANLEQSLGTLKSLIMGQKTKIVKPTKKKRVVVAAEHEAAHGNVETKVNTEPNTEAQGGSSEDDELDAPPPSGMLPINEPIKKLLGKAPYNKMQSSTEITKFIQGCMDLGMLRELAVFLDPGVLKTLAKKKLKQVQAQIQKGS